jgi:L-ascorbate metabolism protein UlaG (beta-lactamase superfamily)
MPTTITYLGHSCFQIRSAGRTLLIDPFLTGNPQAAAAADSVEADFILVSHGHGDHVGDTVAIAERTGATVISNHEIVTWLRQRGVRQTHDMHLGGSHRFDFGTLKLTVAHHGSMLPDGANGGSPAGFLLKTADGTIYHAGDTALFGDMRLIGDAELKVALLPIGDNYTMGPEDSLRAIALLRPQVVVPMHFNTFPAIAQDGTAWATEVSAQGIAKPVVLDPGRSLML